MLSCSNLLWINWPTALNQPFEFKPLDVTLYQVIILVYSPFTNTNICFKEERGTAVTMGPRDSVNEGHWLYVPALARSTFTRLLSDSEATRVDANFER